MGRRYLITGGAGFIGSRFIEHVLRAEPDATVTNYDALLFCGVEATVAELDREKRHTFVQGDVRDIAKLDEVVPGHDVIVHFAAESHVDRSITDPEPFADTNTLGTARLLRAALLHGIGRFVHVSTDEVYGSIASGSVAETAPLAPSSPYAASKAGADLMAHAYGVTFDLDVVVTRCTNNYGPYQYPEKLIPFFITRLLNRKPVPVYGDGSNVRDWLHVADHCRALHLLVDEGKKGDVYNIAAGHEYSNLEVTKMILDAVGHDASLIEFVADRAGHDFRYSLDASKLAAFGWSAETEFESGLGHTVEWYLARRDWWEPLLGRGN